MSLGNVAIDDLIWNYPSAINSLREKSEMYDIPTANNILRKVEPVVILDMDDRVGIEPVFSRIGMKSLKEALTFLEKGGCAFYTCGLFTFFLGRNMSGHWFLVDTHPVPIDCGGTGEGCGIILTSAHPVGICEWLWRRILISKNEKERQSLLEVKSFETSRR